MQSIKGGISKKCSQFTVISSSKVNFFRLLFSGCNHVTFVIIPEESNINLLYMTVIKKWKRTLTDPLKVPLVQKNKNSFLFIYTYICYCLKKRTSKLFRETCRWNLSLQSDIWPSKDNISNLEWELHCFTTAVKKSKSFYLSRERT